MPSPFPNPVTTIPTSPPLPGTGINAFNYGGGDIDGGSLTALAGYGIKALCQTGLIRFSPCARARLNSASIIVFDPSHRLSGALGCLTNFNQLARLLV